MTSTSTQAILLRSARARSENPWVKFALRRGGLFVLSVAVLVIASFPQHPYTQELLASAPTRDSNLLVVDPAAPADVDPPDPHHPPTGCRFHPRCPIGPQVNPERRECVTDEPTLPDGEHVAACHYAATSLGMPTVRSTQLGAASSAAITIS